MPSRILGIINDCWLCVIIRSHHQHIRLGTGNLPIHGERTFAHIARNARTATVAAATAVAHCSDCSILSTARGIECKEQQINSPQINGALHESGRAHTWATPALFTVGAYYTCATCPLQWASIHFRMMCAYDQQAHFMALWRSERI